MKMKYGKITFSYVNMMKYAEHVDETIKIIMKHYRVTTSVRLLYRKLLSQAYLMDNML